MRDILLSLAKSVANTTAALVLKAKNVAAQCKNDQQLQNNIIAAATHCALATSQLNPACREQLISAARQVGAAVERLVEACRAAPAPAAPAVEHLTAAAGRPTVTERSVESVMTCSTRVVSAPDAAEMVKQARLLGQATAHLITNIKDREKQEALRKAAEELRYITVDYAQGQDIVGSQVARLQPSGHVISAARSALPAVSDPAAAKHLALTTHNYTDACTDLRSAVGRARISCKGLEMDAAAEIIRSLQAELDEVILSGRHVLYSSLTLVETVQRYLNSSEPFDTASIGLEQTMESIPSHGELDNVLENINETLNILNMGDFPPAERAYG
ncbi:putative Talin-2 [Operophtera brumata]|uniref:Putative Talin-2 n=1 Tax=Operophtera brumata TaxID=104452 RepID=A0A0L7LAR2_OPEBR|nr:putative Talin-2 [Operophtera brumata]